MHLPFCTRPCLSVVLTSTICCLFFNLKNAAFICLPLSLSPLPQLSILVRTVLAAKKCLFAAGPGAYMVAYACATGGRALRVLNGGGQGGSLLDLTALRPEDLGGTCGVYRRSAVKVTDACYRTI